MICLNRRLSFVLDGQFLGFVDVNVDMSKTIFKHAYIVKTTLFNKHIVGVQEPCN